MNLYALQDSLEQRGVACGGARGRSGPAARRRAWEGRFGPNVRPTAWSVALPLWTSVSATNLPTVAPAPTACGYGPLGGAGSMPGALRRGRSKIARDAAACGGLVYSGLVRAIRPTSVRDLLGGGDRLVLVQLVVERLQADPERLGRLLLIAALFAQGGEYEPALRFGERATDPELDHPARRRSLGLRPVRDLRAQQRNVPGLDLLVGEDEGAVHGILELAHVAQPLVPPQEIQRGAVDPLLLLLGGVELGEERADQQLHVPRALAQRRQPDREHAQAIEQILAQLAVRHRLLGLAVGGRHDADVDLEFALPADPRDDPGLEHAQQAHLQLDRHLADLVEEERAALGALEEALVGACGAGEAATLVPEQLALDQGGRHRGAVERHERALSPAAELMHRLGDQLLSRAALPLHQHGRLGGRHPCDHVVHRLHGRRGSDQGSEVAEGAERAAQRFDLLPEFTPADH